MARDTSNHAATVAEFNKSTGADVDESIIVETLEELRIQGWLGTAPPALTDTETAFLDAHGGVRDNREAIVQARVAARVRHETLQRENMTVEQAAELMGISPSRVRHRLSEGSIYAYPSTGRGVARRIPYWQFRDRSSVPHLASVLAVLPGEFTATEVRDFALHAEVDNPARDVDSVPLLDWLHDGGDPAPARQLAAAQERFI